MFIGRKKELAWLNEKYQEKGGQLVILYGRRRVGKTETLIQFCKDKSHIFYSCIECPDKQQLELFSRQILKDGNPAARYIQTFQDWNQLFDNLAEMSALRTERTVIVIDEFPYMVKNNASIPSVLQNIWDHKLKEVNIMLILCGSSMSFIEKELLSEKNPLYGRATGIYKMPELNYKEAFQFLDGFSIQDKITAYAVLGGIPHYLKQFDTSFSLKENIIRNILTPGSILYSEVEFLLRQELRETGTYNAIIQAVALGNTKLNEIHQKTMIEKSKLSAYLKNLMDLGIVWREFSVQTGVKEQANANRGLYRLTDNYFAFWYSFVMPNQTALAAGDAEGIWEYVIREELDRYTSYAFEKVCWQYLTELNIKNQLPFHFVKIGHWWNKTDEIDVLAFDYKEENFLVGECKYRNQLTGMKELYHLQKKFSQGNCYWYLFSKSGFTEELKDYAEKFNVTLISLKEIQETGD